MPVIDLSLMILVCGSIYAVKALKNISTLLSLMMGAVNKDSVLGASLVLSVVSLVLLFGVTWYFQTSLNLLQQQAEYDRELLLKLQKLVNVRKVSCV